MGNPASRLKISLLIVLLVSVLHANAEEISYESTYKARQAPDMLIHSATLFTGDGGVVEAGYIKMAGGIIEAVGSGMPATLDKLDTALDASGKWVTPGIIDVHSHLGDYPSPGYAPHSDGNEMTAPVTAGVWAEHSVWPQDPQFPLALAGGVTTLQVLPGSANLFGGRSVVVKNVSARTVQGMKFPDAQHGLKMACGENPKRVYGGKGGPATRMGNFAGYRKAWINALEYQTKWHEYRGDLAHFESAPEEEKEEKKKKPSPPKRDLNLETLVGVLEGRILVHNHCYRADEMAQMIDLSREFGYRITAFHHAVEAYKVADLLAANNICAAMWADWGRFKLESFDAVKENVALVHKASACAIVHSDSATGIQRLNQEAAKSLAAGRRMGLDISQAEAFAWITLNPARALGIAERTGSLAKGKMADVVVWNGNPFSVYSRVEKVYIDGSLVYDLEKDVKPVTDFELGHRVRGL
ncbi:MAG: amidohydrolase [Gammaproteobacteria bacterium]|jgi:imidazolonepropionase-like amidohydrolase|nr:amidohydrolase [Gammaproteobacteria bacterium]|tara:strand:+ start:227 stop:1636 length:1410 start_codon:yes stop_codon:yes gene_type:complete